MPDLVQSATLFREASGVFQHLANEVFPSLQSSQSVERPLEATPSMCTVMSIICLAEAQVSFKDFAFQYSRISILGSCHLGLKLNAKSFNIQGFVFYLLL